MRYEDFDKVETALKKIDLIRRVLSMAGDEIGDDMSIVLAESHDAIRDAFEQARDAQMSRESRVVSV